MKIYTKKGDAGETSLSSGLRVPKDDLRIRTYGTLEELGAELATPRGKKLFTQPIEASAITQLENEIDEMEKALAPLKNFILPGGSEASALLHVARTICRRAERELVTLHRSEPHRPEVLQYLNRLADFLFVAARFANHEAKVADVPWVAPQPAAAQP